MLESCTTAYQEYHYVEQVPEDKPAEALALFKRVTYPSETGVIWNPSPATPLHISSTTDLVAGQAEATVGPATFPAQPATQLAVNRGEALTLRVAAAGGYGDMEMAPHLYMFEWAKDGLPLAVASESTFTLKISSMAECDAGIYTCTVSTLDGDVVVSQPVRLIVAPALNSTGPTIPGTRDDVAAAAAVMLPGGVGLLIGVIIGCVGRRAQCCGAKRADGLYEPMPTDEE